MTRIQTAAASLVAAIPAGLVGALLVMVFLNHAENLQTMTQVLVGGTLLVVATVVLMPFGILIFGGRSKPAAAKSKAVGPDHEDTIATSDEIIATDDEAEEDTETLIYEGSDLEETDEFLDEEEDTDFLSDDELLVDEEEDEEPPKKSKR